MTRCTEPKLLKIDLDKKIESELRENNKTLDHALSIAKLGNWVWEIQTNALNWSEEMYAIFELPTGNSVDLDVWSNMIYIDDRGYVDKVFREAGVNSNTFNISYRIKTFEGNLRYLKSEGEVFLSDENEPVRMMGVVMDITEQKNLEEALNNTANSAESANQAKRNFLTTMSHELRTPLHGVLGMAELAMLTKLDAKQQDYLDTIYNASQALLRVLNDILDISRIEANSYEVVNKGFDLCKTIKCIEQLFVGAAKSKDLVFSCQKLPQISDLLIGDQNRLTQILSNLIANAIKFTDIGSVNIMVDILRENQDGIDIYFEVKDTGIGIPQGIQQFIFQSFTQEDSSSTRKYNGVGLGLSIVKKIVGLMGGEIGVESKHGQGSTFWIKIPFKKEKRKIAAPVLKPIFGDGKGDNIIKAKKDTAILLVEDDPIGQTVMEGIIKKLGYSLDILPNGAAALSVIPQKQYDLIFMDCRMPIKDGFETTKEIRLLEQQGKLELYTPIIAITANAMKGDQEKGIEAGMDEYIIKPLRFEIIENILNQYL